jgi:hypothetical protein
VQTQSGFNFTLLAMFEPDEDMKAFVMDKKE